MVTIREARRRAGVGRRVCWMPLPLGMMLIIPLVPVNGATAALEGFIEGCREMAGQFKEQPRLEREAREFLTWVKTRQGQDWAARREK